MKPAPFRYIAATSLDHALSLKAQYGEDARFLAGGQSLIPAMNFRLARPAVLIDINALTELAGIDRTNGQIRIRALTDQELSWRQSFNVIMLWEFASALAPGMLGGGFVFAIFILNRERINKTIEGV